jgi:AcrR family transcriptional regulator
LGIVPGANRPIIIVEAVNVDITSDPKQAGGEARLIQVATGLIASVGPEVSVDQICAASGLSKGAFYHHFRSKRELMLRVVAELCAGPPLAAAVWLRLLPLARRDPVVAALLARHLGWQDGEPTARLASALAIGNEVARTLGRRRAA